MNLGAELQKKTHSFGLNFCLNVRQFFPQNLIYEVALSRLCLMMRLEMSVSHIGWLLDNKLP